MSVLRSRRRAPPGVNIVGYFNHVVGLGESARQFASALALAGVPTACAALDLGDHAPRLPEPGAPWLADAELPHGLTVIWANPDRYGLDVVPGELPGTLVGRWAWELAALPQSWAVEAQWFREIWTPSRFVRAAVRASVTIPVRRIPMPVALPDAGPLDRARWNLGAEDFLFLYLFDYHSTIARKNPQGVIEAFSRAFEAQGPARLLVKTVNARSTPEAADAVIAAAAENPAVQVIDVALPTDQRLALLAGCDCYVSLHRSEGFGMTIAEAMGYGRPVIATDYGGCRDFLTRRTGYPVSWVGAGVSANPVYPIGSTWAEPELDHAAALMREILSEPASARIRGRRAAARIATHHAPAAVAGKLNRVLRRAVQGRRSRSRA